MPIALLASSLAQASWSPTDVLTLLVVGAHVGERLILAWRGSAADAVRHAQNAQQLEGLQAFMRNFDNQLADLARSSLPPEIQNRLVALAAQVQACSGEAAGAAAPGKAQGTA